MRGFTGRRSPSVQRTCAQTPRPPPPPHSLPPKGRAQGGGRRLRPGPVRPPASFTHGESRLSCQRAGFLRAGPSPNGTSSDIPRPAPCAAAENDAAAVRVSQAGRPAAAAGADRLDGAYGGVGGHADGVAGRRPLQEGHGVGQRLVPLRAAARPDRGGGASCWGYAQPGDSSARYDRPDRIRNVALEEFVRLESCAYRRRRTFRKIDIRGESSDRTRRCCTFCRRGPGSCEPFAPTNPCRQLWSTY